VPYSGCLIADCRGLLFAKFANLRTNQNLLIPRPNIFKKLGVAFALLCLLFRMRNSRHSYSTLLHSLGAAPAVQKELLRHANIQTTMNIYTQAVTPAKREAASKVVDVLWRM
jgi:integrase